MILSWLPVTVPLVGIGLLFWFGHPRPGWLAYVIAAGVPLLVGGVCAVEPVTRIARRVDDGNRQARLVEGNDVKLIWAPAGPAWPKHGVNWDEAQRACKFLSEDGSSLADTPQDIWRLPSVEEAVASLTRHGRNCGGQWDPSAERARYEIKPDKESPLWDTHSPIIYWWTSTEGDDHKAYVVVYNGRVCPRRKKLCMGSLAFRAVKNAPDG